jgi:hypothetical protein
MTILHVIAAFVAESHKAPTGGLDENGDIGGFYCWQTIVHQEYILEGYYSQRMKVREDVYQELYLLGCNPV